MWFFILEKLLSGFFKIGMNILLFKDRRELGYFKNVPSGS
jgi:hypothetical protein